MFSASVLLGLLLSGSAIASPLSLDSRTVAPDVSLTGRSAPEVGIKWTGSIFPGEEPTELWGDAHEILAQILAINPDYVAPVPENATDVAAIERRWVLTCRVMASGQKNTAKNRLAKNLKAIGGQCTTPHDQCRRLDNWDTTAAYLCSEDTNGASVSCYSAGSTLEEIADGCCGNGKLSGHIYHSDWSIWGGYGNGNHPTDRRPTYYPYPGGQPTCGN